MFNKFLKGKTNLLLQENLEAIRKQNDLIDTLSNLLNAGMNQKIEDKAINKKSDSEKLQAAYALNLCTVSVSQIIDYNDAKFLEFEYDTILNNLNIEKMPKDEALLRILKQLLDVITFFRIQEGDRELMNEEYSQKIKNAIWSAVPNIGLIVAGGPPPYNGYFTCFTSWNRLYELSKRES